MLQQLTAQTQAQSWAIASMLFFFVIFVAITWQVLRGKRERYDALAALPLSDGAAQPAYGHDTTSTQGATGTHN